ncbi:MAG: hypothetical protein JNM35_16210, partial [Nitrospira sp.]|nr:hypothetical protein [Nitrospira sp.]
PLPRAQLEAAVDQILELTVAFSDLDLKPDDRIQMHVEMLARQQSIDRAPREGSLDLAMPSPDFELVMWQA